MDTKKVDTKKMQACSQLLPDPGGEVGANALTRLNGCKKTQSVTGGFAHAKLSVMLKFLIEVVTAMSFLAMRMN